MLNTSVSLGRAGIPVNFISDFGTDPPGEIMADFLKKNGISTTYLQRYNDGQTALALAFLDEEQNAGYSFYKNYPRERMTGLFPRVEKDDILLFGSIFAITSEIRGKLIGFVREAARSGAIVLYDPNFRRSHLHELPQILPLIRENLSFSTIVRGSDEDFLNIFASGNCREAFTELSALVSADQTPWLVYTKNKAGVQVIGGQIELEVPVPPVKPVSTIGAGDAFNAGLIYHLVKNKIGRADLAGLGEPEWKEMVKTAIGFAGNVCMSYENYIAPDWLNKIELC
jgi:fructokinase